MALPIVAGAASSSMLGTGGASAVGTAGAAGGGTAMTEGIKTTSSLISGILNFMAVKDTNEKALAKDSLESARLDRMNTAQIVLSNRALDLNEKSTKFNQEEAKANRKENTEQRGYNRIQSSFQRAADLWSQMLTAQNTIVSPLMRRG